MRPTHLQLILHGRDEGIEEVEKQRVGLTQLRSHHIRHGGAEHDRPHAVLAGGMVDVGDHRTRLVIGVDEGKGQRLEIDTIELGQQAVAQGFGGDARSVGHEEDATVGL